ncbi:MAG TPA: Lrp/AsnC family transcriptional regulator [Burkholderiaceae bacterium]|nr:Lrp/AsnC family transcriptional regulator [Burkholderiaceae bacterium]
MNPDPATVNQFEFDLLNRFQRDFPLQPRPFTALAAALDRSEAEVLASLRRLRAAGAISRVGAVFRPNAIGASALAALAVPAARLEDVARHVSSFPEVNHNYEREHHFNLWFVAAAPSAARLRAVLADIEASCACGALLVLPLVEDYHIDLGFDLSAAAGDYSAPAQAADARAPRDQVAPALNASEQRVVAALQDGLPLVERPFACLGVAEEEAIAIIAHWLESGVVKRFGVVVRHHELGYTANAMAVWDVPDDAVGAIGRRIAASGRVTLCYRRPRQLPDWRHNLFCMMHGKDRAQVQAHIAVLATEYGLAAYPSEILFSRRRFKQRGAHYASVRHG